MTLYFISYTENNVFGPRVTRSSTPRSLFHPRVAHPPPDQIPEMIPETISDMTSGAIPEMIPELIPGVVPRDDRLDDPGPPRRDFNYFNRAPDPIKIRLKSIKVD